MNVCELIEACGVDNVQVQFLDNCADSIDWSAKSGTKIKFGTEVGLHRDPTIGTEKLGMVVWLDRDSVKAAQAKARSVRATPDPLTARLVEALRAVHDELLKGAEADVDGEIVSVSRTVWNKICAALARQDGGK